MKNIDMHSHYIPKAFIDLIEEENNKFEAKIVTKDGQRFVAHDQGYIYPCLPEFYDRSVKLEKMEKGNIDMTVLSLAPPLFYYWTDIELSVFVAQMVNDELLEYVQKDKDKFSMMATVPMNSVEHAVKELNRIVKKSSGLVKFVQIGTNVEGRLLADPIYKPFFNKAEELGVTVFLHPYYIGNKPGLEDYYLTNLVGNPMDTTISAVNLMFSGFMERHPKLNICLAHGGGYLPYQFGRLRHGYKVREEPKSKMAAPPLENFNRFYFDTLTFEKKAIEYLVNLVGSERIILGSDFPFDMGDEEAVKMVQSLNIPNEDKENILYKNVDKLLNV